MRRYHSLGDVNRTYRAWREHVLQHQRDNLNQGESPEEIGCSCDEQMGMFRKRRAFYDTKGPFDLGKSLQQAVADLDYAEQLDEALAA